MQYIFVVIVVALAFGVCFLVDKAFAKLFRSQAQHRSGTAVRLSKRYASAGLIFAVIGLGAVFAGISEGWALSVGGAVMMLLGTALVVYYISYAVFYDGDSFIFTTFGKKAKTYYYRDILQQQLYDNRGHLLIELHMADGDAVHLQTSMEGCIPFLNHAFAAWLQQTGRKEEDCPFHDPEKSCWFPPVEG